MSLHVLRFDALGCAFSWIFWFDYHFLDKKRDLQKRIEALQKSNKKLKGYKGLVKEFGDDPDEIRLKLNQIYDWNEKK